MDSNELLEWLYADIEDLIDMAIPQVEKENLENAGKQHFETGDGP